jgi:hypothetical protein
MERLIITPGALKDTGDNEKSRFQHFFEGRENEKPEVLLSL